MPAATVNSGPHSNVFGSAAVEIVDVTWTDSDTYTSPNLASILWGYFVPTTNASYGLTFATNIATFKSGGSLTGKLVLFGDFR
jgi:hypothetical protein